MSQDLLDIIRRRDRYMRQNKKPDAAYLQWLESQLREECTVYCQHQIIKTRQAHENKKSNN